MVFAIASLSTSSFNVKNVEKSSKVCFIANLLYCNFIEVITSEVATTNGLEDTLNLPQSKISVF